MRDNESFHEPKVSEMSCGISHVISMINAWAQFTKRYDLVFISWFVS